MKVRSRLKMTCTATVHWISSSLDWEFSALNNTCLKKHRRSVVGSRRREGKWQQDW